VSLVYISPVWFEEVDVVGAVVGNTLFIGPIVIIAAVLVKLLLGRGNLEHCKTLPI